MSVSSCEQRRLIRLRGWVGWVSSSFGAHEIRYISLAAFLILIGMALAVSVYATIYRHPQQKCNFPFSELSTAAWLLFSCCLFFVWSCGCSLRVFVMFNPVRCLIVVILLMLSSVVITLFEKRKLATLLCISLWLLYCLPLFYFVPHENVPIRGSCKKFCHWVRITSEISATFYQTYFYYKPSKYSPFTETHFCNLSTQSRKADK